MLVTKLTYSYMVSDMITYILWLILQAKSNEYVCVQENNQSFCNPLFLTPTHFFQIRALITLNRPSRVIGNGNYPLLTSIIHSYHLIRNNVICYMVDGSRITTLADIVFIQGLNRTLAFS